jgi:hypothetical protein
MYNNNNNEKLRPDRLGAGLVWGRNDSKSRKYLFRSCPVTGPAFR